MKNKLKIVYTIFAILAVIAIATVSASSYGYGESSGGGTCGEGGVITGENLGNIESYKTIEKDLVGNMSTIYQFTTPEFSIYQVIITSKEDKCLVAVRLEHLNGTSKIAKVDAPGNVFANENVWIGTQIVRDDVSVRFRVKNSWMSDNGITSNDVRLLQYDIKEGNWKQQDTNVEHPEVDSRSPRDVDADYTYFESKAAGILIFAISGLKSEVIVSVPIGTPSPITEKEIAAIKTTKVPGFDIAIALMSVSAIYIFRRRL